MILNNLWTMECMYVYVYIYVCMCCAQSLSRVQLFAPHEAHQAPLSMEFSRQEYWSGLSFPTPHMCVCIYIYIYIYIYTRIFLKLKMTSCLLTVVPSEELSCWKMN